MSDLTIDWNQFGIDATSFGQRLLGYGKQWTGIIAIARGGLPLATVLANILNVRVIDVVLVRSYKGREQKDIEILKAPSNNGGVGYGWLIVDDLIDSGKTMRAVKDLVPFADSAVLYAKPQGAACVKFFGQLINQETWINSPWEVDEEESVDDKAVQAALMEFYPEVGGPVMLPDKIKRMKAALAAADRIRGS